MEAQPRTPSPGTQRLGKSHFAHRTKSSQRICYILQISTEYIEPEVKEQIVQDRRRMSCMMELYLQRFPA